MVIRLNSDCFIVQSRKRKQRREERHAVIKRQRKEPDGQIKMSLSFIRIVKKGRSFQNYIFGEILFDSLNFMAGIMQR